MKMNAVLNSGTSAMKMQLATTNLASIPVNAEKATQVMATIVITFARQTPRNLAIKMHPACDITRAIMCAS